MPCGIAWQARQAAAIGRLPAPADGLPAYLSPQAAHLLVGVSVYREPIGRNAVLSRSASSAPVTATWRVVPPPGDGAAGRGGVRPGGRATARHRASAATRPPTQAGRRAAGTRTGGGWPGRGQPPRPSLRYSE